MNCYEKNIIQKCQRKPAWAKFLINNGKCPKKIKLNKNNILSPNFDNKSSKMRYAELIKKNGNHWNNNRLYQITINSYLNKNNSNNGKNKYVC